MATEFQFVIEVPISVLVQDEELEDCEDERQKRIARLRLTGRPHASITIERVIMERAQEVVQDALQVGSVQHNGALMVVTAREFADRERVIRGMK